MSISEYLDSVNKKFKSGVAKEHAYRSDLEVLIRSLVAGVDITNEPSNVTDCGNPDYVIMKGKIPIGYIEAKDIGKDLDSKVYKEQFERYRKALDNLIITDYIYFRFYQGGKLVHEIRIAEIISNSIKAIPSTFESFEDLIRDFCTYISQTITSAKKLAELMAYKARLLESTILAALTSDEISQENTSIKDQYESFKHILIHDLTPKDFSDIYAQTLAYGMFAARLHDTSLNDFTRHEASELIPKTNPFLRKLFGYIAGPDIDERIRRTVDNLADVFRATNIEALLNNIKSASNGQDPIIHFYETFLSEYDPALRKSRGVWYTPQPVVNFIVRAVDDILKSEFNLKDGLADTSKIKIKVKDVTKATADLRSKTKAIEREEEIHRVQILDPATGTGTFLAEVVKQIYKNFEGQHGIWGNYVEQHLLPRLNGFEILMASYAMAHLKLDLLLSETGYKQQKEQRFRIYLTNSLEEHHPDTGTLFANWLSSEANEANHIKRDTPVMVILGNPPYSVSSSNKGNWITALMEDYKKNLNEKNINPLSDDYLKFIRFGQYYIEKNGEGILAYITNNSFLNGAIHRQMRRTLINSFDLAFIVNLHGSSKIQESSPDGSKDENVFDIQQGVSLNIFVKNKLIDKKPCIVNYCDIWGLRTFKYNELLQNSYQTLKFKPIEVTKPNFYFIPQNSEVRAEFEAGFSIKELFTISSSGIQTEFDDIAIQSTEDESKKIYLDITTLNIEDLLSKYNLPRKYVVKFQKAKEDLINNSYVIRPILYRPFEIKSVIYTGCSNGIMGRPREDTMKNMFSGENISLVLKRARLLGKEKKFNHCFVSNLMIDKNFLADQSYCLPLYIYPELNGQKNLEFSSKRIPNLNSKLVNEIGSRLSLNFTEEKDYSETTFSPIDLLDYIYSILNNSIYREKYNEFLGADFPRIPYPKDIQSFWQLVKLGGELRQIHLLENPIIEKRITTYPKSGNNIVDHPRFENSKVWINQEQYFHGVPQVAWIFYIGGCQPAQKWLKDRKGRELSFEDILHYQKIIVALSETDRLMKEIDKIEIE